MAEIVENYTVEARGVGAPDYSNTVSSSRERRGLRLQYNQQVKIFAILFADIASPYPWVQLALASGAQAHVIDMETGLAMPYTINAGYTLSIVDRHWGLNQDRRERIFFDGFLIMGYDIGGGNAEYLQEVVPLSSSLLDPTGATAHTIDHIVTNMGGANMYGGLTVLTILEAVGTPPFPTTKTTKCPFCAKEQVESVHATRITCSSCGKIYIVYDLTNFKGTT
jgi:ribosomal protein S27AE